MNLLVSEYSEFCSDYLIGYALTDGRSGNSGSDSLGSSLAPLSLEKLELRGMVSRRCRHKRSFLLSFNMPPCRKREW